MESVALIETFWAGHHPTYFKYFVKTFLELGFKVWAFCPNISEVRVWVEENCTNEQSNHLWLFSMPELSQATVFPLKKQFHATIVGLTYWLTTKGGLERAIEVTGEVPKLVFFPKIDPWLEGAIGGKIIDKIFPYPWSGIIFQPYHLRFESSTDWLRRGWVSPYAALHAKKCQAITMFDETLTAKLQSKISKYVFAFPDFADNSLPYEELSITNEIRTRASGRKIIGLLGALDERKGVYMLQHVAERADKRKYFFLFAGKPKNNEEKKRIESNHAQANFPENSYYFLEKIPDERYFNSMISICDIIFAAYKSFPYSSNLLTKAALFEKPTIVSKGGLLEDRIKRYQIGIALPEDDIDACVNGLNYLSYEYTPSVNGFIEYRKMHSLEQMKIVFEQLISLY